MDKEDLHRWLNLQDSTELVSVTCAVYLKVGEPVSDMTF
jgi:hypothetical protein